MEGQAAARAHAGEHGAEAVLLERLVRCPEAVPVNMAAVRTDLVRKVAHQALLPRALQHTDVDTLSVSHAHHL